MKKRMMLLAMLLAVVLCLPVLAAAVTSTVPEGYPAIIEGLDFGGATVYIYDWYSSGQRVEDPTENLQRQYDYWDWLEETYHVHVIQTALSDWVGMTDALTRMVAEQDSSKLCIVAVAGSFAGTPLKNSLYMPWTYDLENGNTATQEYMTQGGVCYGTSSSSHSEPRQAVFFNKGLLEDAGINWQEIYTAQNNGTWTWSKMESYMASVQRDTDGDGATDVWGLTGNGDDITIGLVVSNGAEFYQYNDDGKLAPAIESDEMREALACRQSWNRYLAPSTSWDGYQQNWAEGKAAFFIGQSYEGFNGNGSVNAVNAWGFVAMPKGPRMNHYATVVEDNVYGVPNIYDEATSQKLQQLFRLWTRPLPGTEDSWSAGFEELTDEQAIETYGMLREPENGTIMNYNLIGSRNDTVSEVLWSIDSGTVDEVIDNALPAFQERCDEFNRTEELEWTLSDDGVLTISGTGKMKTHPWASRAGEITEVIIEEGVTSICSDAFSYCANLTTVRLPLSLTDIGEGAFPDSCTSLTDVYYNGLQIDWDGGFVLPWGTPGNDAIVTANVHCRETSPAGDQYPVMLNGISIEKTGEQLTPGDDGYYTAGNNEDILFSYSAPDMEGYTKGYRFTNGMWWDIPSDSGEAGVIGHSSRISLAGTENDVTATAMAVWFPADPGQPVLTSTLDIPFHVLHEECGITVSGPAAYTMGDPEGYLLNVTVPETTVIEGAEWGIEYYYRESDEYIYGSGGQELLPGENIFCVPADRLTEEGTVDYNFWFNGVGYDSFSSGSSFEVIRPEAPLVILESADVIKDSYAKFEIRPCAAQNGKIINEVRYTRTDPDGYSYTSYKYGRQTPEGYMILEESMFSAGTFYYSFSAEIDGAWTEYSEPVAVTCRSLGQLPAPEWAAVPENLQAGEPVSVDVGFAENVKQYYIKIEDEDGEYAASGYAFDPGNQEVIRFGLSAGSYLVYIRASGDGWDESDFTSGKPLTVTGSRPQVPAVTNPEGTHYAYDRVWITVQAEGLEALAETYTSSQIYLSNGNTGYYPIRASVPGGWLNEYTLRAKISGRWTEEFKVSYVGEEGQGDDGTLLNVIDFPQSIRLGQDLTIRTEIPEGAKNFSFSISRLGNGDDAEQIVYDYKTQIAYDYRTAPDAQGNWTIPAMFFTEAGTYDVGLDVSGEGVYKYCVRQLTVTANPDRPQAPTVVAEPANAQLYENVTIRVSAAGGDAQNATQACLIIKDTEEDNAVIINPIVIDLVNGAGEYVFNEMDHRFYTYSNSFKVSASICSGGVWSEYSSPAAFRFADANGSLQAPADMLTFDPRQVAEGETVAISWKPVEGAEQYRLTLDWDEILYTGDGSVTSYTLNTEGLEGGEHYLCIKAYSVGKEPAESAERFLVLDPAAKPTVRADKDRVAPDEPVTLTIGTIKGDFVLVYVDDILYSTSLRDSSGTQQAVLRLANTGMHSIRVNTGYETNEPSSVASDPVMIQVRRNADLVLPASLEMIEQGAFEGVMNVTISVPGSLTDIAVGAIDPSATILAPANSPAALWFREHGYTVIEE